MNELSDEARSLIEQHKLAVIMILMVVCLRLFYARRHPVRSARWSDTEPRVGSDF